VTATQTTARRQAIENIPTGTRLERRRFVSRERLGRIIGATGAGCATLLWAFLALSFLAFLVDADSFGFGIIIGLPVVLLSSTFAVVAASDLAALLRRADRLVPWRLATTHAVLAIVLLWAQAWIPGLVVGAIAATQFVALQLFRQMTPSQPAPQR
jgi:hypothetical protein